LDIESGRVKAMSTMMGRWSDPALGPAVTASGANSEDVNTLSMLTSGSNGITRRIGQVRWKVLVRNSPVSRVKRCSFKDHGVRL
jgi:hypothetical protein